MEHTPLTSTSQGLSKDIIKTGASAKKTDDTQVESDSPKATSLQITFNLITCGLGTGVFTLPWSTAGASILPALVIVAAVLALNAWTISILVEAAERHQTFDLGSLLARLPGRIGQVAQYVCNIVLWLSMFLCLVGYIIVMVDCVETYLAVAPGGERHPHRMFFVAAASAAVLPLCFLDQRRLAFTSFLALAANANILAFLLASVATEEEAGVRPPLCFFGLAPGCVAMVSAMMQVVVIQMCVLPMYKELENRSPAKFNNIVLVSFSGLLFICWGFAIAGYATYGQDVSSNVLRNLPGSHWGHVSRLAAAVAVAGVFPIVLNSMVAPLWNSEAFATLQSKTISAITTCSIVMTVMVAACFASDLGFLMSSMAPSAWVPLWL